jgi:hypothetical protein
MKYFTLIDGVLRPHSESAESKFQSGDRVRIVKVGICATVDNPKYQPKGQIWGDTGCDTGWVSVWRDDGVKGSAEGGAWTCREHDLELLTTEKQDTFRCKHYPSAINNLRDGVEVCEHGCEKMELRWWDNGTHPAPPERKLTQSPWLTSYTNKIVRDLKTKTPGSRRKAAALLEQYWRDLHIPYEQRDAARAELKNVKEDLARERLEGLRLKNDIEKLKQENLLLRRSIGRAQVALL